MKKIIFVLTLIMFLSMAAVSADDLNCTDESFVDFDAADDSLPSFDDESGNGNIHQKENYTPSSNWENSTPFYYHNQNIEGGFSEIYNKYKNDVLVLENGSLHLSVEDWPADYYGPENPPVIPDYILNDPRIWNSSNLWPADYYDPENPPVIPDYILNDPRIWNSSNPCARPGMTLKFIRADDLVKYYGEAKNFDVWAFAIDSDYVVFTINNHEYRRTIVSGSASLPINMGPGMYNITYSYPRVNQSIKNTITVLSTIESNDLVKYYKNASQFEVRLLDSNGNHTNSSKKVTFNINGVFYTRQINDEGIARLNINLNPGQYIITTNNPFTGENKSNVVTVLPYIESHDLVKYYMNDSQFVVRITDEKGNYVGAGEEVTFNINGVFYTRHTNATGHVKLNVNLNPDDYIITTQYGGCSVSNNIKVLSVLNASDLEMSYHDGSKFTVNLLDNAGNPYSNQIVTFNINGVFYNRTTDAYGDAKLNINLQAGEYIITSSYNGSNIANTIIIYA